MKAVVGIITAGLLMLWLMEFIQRRENMRNSNFLRQQAFQPLNLSCRINPPKLNPQEHGRGTCDLTYSYKDKDKILYRFDPRPNTLNKTTDANKLDLEVEFKPAFGFPIRESIEILHHASHEIVRLLSSKTCAHRRILCLAAIVGVLIIFESLKDLLERRSKYRRTQRRMISDS